jgi:hypothetical protein
MQPKSLSSISNNSLATLIKNSAIIHRIELAVSEKINLRIVFADAFVEAYVDRLGFLGVSTVENMERLLLEKESFTTKYLIAWFRGPGAGRLQFIPEGISISFLGWIMVLEKGGLPALTDFLTKHAFNKNQDIQKLAANLECAYKQAF